MVKSKKNQQAQNPLLLRCNRLMEAFAKSDDERDFYLDKVEGFIIYVDLDKLHDELLALEKELEKNPDRYYMIPKLTFYETKKIMEGFVHEKVYDIDTKEKLLDIIQSKEARENFLEFIYDHHNELEKWQQYYQERSRVRIIEWLRKHHFYFVFEEDLDFSRKLLEKMKEELFEAKVSKDIAAARKILESKAKTYYSSEALNPRPKRGRPPKQIVKTEAEPQVSVDLYTTVAPSIRPFLFTPEISGTAAMTFSTKFETEEKLMAIKRGGNGISESQSVLASLNQKLADLRSLSNKWFEEESKRIEVVVEPSEKELQEIDEEKDEELEFEEESVEHLSKKGKKKPTQVMKAQKKIPLKKSKRAPAPKKKAKKEAPIKPISKKQTKSPRKIKPAKRKR